jgi:hypothetical protein
MKQNSANITGSIISPTKKWAEVPRCAALSLLKKSLPKGGFSRICSYTESKFMGSACVRDCVVRYFLTSIGFR